MSTPQTILIAEDDAVNREIAVIALKHAGYNILTARDGGEALEIFKAKKDEIDLLLTDILMPRMDGIALSRAARQIKPELPIVIISAIIGHHSSTEIREITPFFIQKASSVSMLQILLDSVRAALMTRP